MALPPSSPEIPRHRFNTNAWNRFRYTLWAPTYDAVAGGFTRARQRALASLALQPGQRVIIVGAGTGLDLPWFPRGVRLTAVDLTPAMIAKLRAKAARLGLDVDARVLDGQALDFPSHTFDAAVLHLILAVVPDPVRCLREVNRVLKPGGRVSVMDKFLPAHGWRRTLLRLANPIMGCLASETNRELAPLVAASGMEVVQDNHALAGGVFRLVLLQKPPAP